MPGKHHMCMHMHMHMCMCMCMYAIGPHANTNDTRAMRVPSSCTYVPLKQRYDGYAKYAERIGYGLRAFAGLRRSVERNEWEAAAAAVLDADAGPPAPARDVLLKAATAPRTPTHTTK
jgi:hypothetical protein